jgi:hypothetical protein
LLGHVSLVLVLVYVLLLNQFLELLTFKNNNMKNIFLLATNEPSRLWMNTITDKLELSKNSDTFNAKNIYITFDGEIKENEWVISNGEMTKASPKIVNSQGLLNRKAWKKVILTTDPTLIADGIQAIDDTFLEWFVKNPSCDGVEVKVEKFGIWRLGYKIVIPQEEPKLCDGDLYFVGMVTDITEEYECLRCGQKYRYTAKNRSCNFFQLTKCTKGIPQEEPKPLDNLVERFKRDMSMIVMPLDNKNIPEEPLEEATETEIYLAINQIIAGGKDLIKGHVVSRGHAIDYAFDIALKSTKQQAERMYSEEEIRKAIQLARLCTLDNVTGEFVDLSGLTEVCTYGLEETHSEDSIIEQFKKK